MSDTYGIGGALWALFIFGVLLGCCVLAFVLFLFHHLHVSIGWTP